MTLKDNDFRDEELRNRFAALRRQEEAQVPLFALPHARGRMMVGQPSFRRMLASAALLTLVTAASLLFLLHSGPQQHPGNAVASLSEWKSPTDFLLNTPGREVLRTVPRIGAWHDYTQSPEAKQKLPQAGKQAKP